MKKLLIIGAVVVAVAALIFLSLARTGHKGDAEVETARVDRKDLTEIVRASGTIEPKRSVDVSANTIGTITNLAVEEGQTVAQGDLLLEIDPTEYRAALQALEAAVRTGEADLQLAEASAEKADIDLKRAESLFREGLNSEEAVQSARTNARVEHARVEAAQSQLQQTHANLEKARHDLEKVTLTAPMSGIITKLNVEEGENAIMGTLNNPGTVLLSIADLGTMEAWVEVDETEVVDVRLGQKATIDIDAFPDTTYTGTVTEIGHSPINTSTGAGQEAVDFEVKITLDERIPHIRPGLSAKAEITVATRKEALAVPLGSVTVRNWPLRDSDIRTYRGGQARRQGAALDSLGFTTEGVADSVKTKETEGVFVLRDGFVKFVPVTIGIAGEESFEITRGVTEGESVVSGPFRELRELKDGAEVREAHTGGKKGKKDRNAS